MTGCGFVLGVSKRLPGVVRIPKLGVVWWLAFCFMTAGVFATFGAGIFAVYVVYTGAKGFIGLF